MQLKKSGVTDFVVIVSPATEEQLRATLGSTYLELPVRFEMIYFEHRAMASLTRQLRDPDSPGVAPEAAGHRACHGLPPWPRAPPLCCGQCGHHLWIRGSQ